ncbi:MAG: glycine zipper 2TM domain-containing protein [Alphaproteobacteria bacterium]|nr:glycine zipper 2TM domain-containing protein [Alphaproteobacteria bacterium]
MTRSMTRLIILGAAALSLAACEGQSPEAQRRTGQVVGGVTGAVVGSAFGGGTGRVIATGAGAVLGAVAGGEIADRMN